MTYLINDLKKFLSLGTLDAILPMVVFLVMKSLTTLLIGGLVASFTALILLSIKLYKKQVWYYAVAGFLGVLIASLFALVFSDAKGYVIPDLISGGFMTLLALISIVIKKPLAMWLSHLTRGWPLKWFLRPDILPAYMRVSIIWTLLLIIRFVALLLLFFEATESMLFFVNILLGLPLTVVVMIFSFVYGIYLLKSLKGPSVDEFINKTPAPWVGQRKGF